MRALLWLLLAAATAGAQPEIGIRTFFAPADTLEPTVDSLRALCALRPPGSTEPVPGALQDYFEYYGLNFSGTVHGFGALPVTGGTLAVHTYLPPQPKGTVLAVHGYLTHSGTLNHLIARLLREGYAVAAMDMPGHGLSSGRRGAVDDFATYAAAFERFAAYCHGVLPEPFTVVGHSTGGATVLEYLFTRKEPVVGSAVLVAPLVRSVLWRLSKAGYVMGGALMEDVPRVMMTKVSSDPEYVEFTRNYDPLQLKAVPTDWVRALYAWDERHAGYPRVRLPVLLLQGDHDQVVDADYNIPFLKDKFPELKIVMVEDGRHELLNEREELREMVLDKIADFLKTNAQHPTFNIQRPNAE